MADISEQRLNIQVEETRYNAAVSEAVAQRLGKSINFINKRQYQAKTFQINGPYGGIGVPVLGIDGAWGMFNNSEIVGLLLYNLTAGASGTLEIDLKKITQSGATPTSIFTTTPKLSYTSGDNAYLFYDFLNSVALENPTGATQPVLVSTDLDAGDLIRCDLLSVQAASARNAGIVIYYRPR
jgi:hypothetical protein